MGCLHCLKCSIKLLGGNECEPGHAVIHIHERFLIEIWKIKPAIDLYGSESMPIRNKRTNFDKGTVTDRIALLVWFFHETQMGNIPVASDISTRSLAKDWFSVGGHNTSTYISPEQTIVASKHIRGVCWSLKTRLCKNVSRKTANAALNHPSARLAQER